MAKIRFNKDEKYFSWLEELIGSRGRSSLLLDLMNIHFDWVIDMDVNRCADVSTLRENFMHNTGSYDHNFNSPCRVLEVLIYLAIRFDDFMPDPETDEEKESRPGIWFWEMIQNIGLYNLTDEVYYKDNKDFKITKQVNQTINTLLYRRYDTDGSGGLFPLKNPKEDQRKVEIWYQMNAYLLEKLGLFH